MLKEKTLGKLRREYERELAGDDNRFRALTDLQSLLWNVSTLAIEAGALPYVLEHVLDGVADAPKDISKELKARATDAVFIMNKLTAIRRTLEDAHERLTADLPE
jgi:hypothetical protein